MGVGWAQSAPATADREAQPARELTISPLLSASGGLSPRFEVEPRYLCTFISRVCD